MIGIAGRGRAWRRSSPPSPPTARARDRWLRAPRREGARRVRRSGRRCGRHVLHRRLRARDDGRRHDAGAGAQPAVAAVPVGAGVGAAVGHQRRRPRAGEGAAARGRACSGCASPRTGGAGRAVRDAAPRARRRVHRGGDRLVDGQPARHPAGRALGAHRGPRRRARPPHAGRTRPGAGALPRAAAPPGEGKEEERGGKDAPNGGWPRRMRPRQRCTRAVLACIGVSCCAPDEPGRLS